MCGEHLCRWCKKDQPIKVKGKPDHTRYHQSEEAAALLQPMVKLETRNFTDCISSDKTETEVDDYLPDDTPIPMETDSSEAESFEDKNIVLMSRKYKIC